MTRNALWAFATLLLMGLALGCSRERERSKPETKPTAQQEAQAARTPASPPATAAAPASPAAARASADTATDFGELSDALVRWGVQATTDRETPHIPLMWVMLLKPYGAIWLGDPSKKEIFLTFDAGFEAGYTPHLLDVLKAEEVPAAFFLSGHYVAGQPGLVKRMLAEGHIVGNHGYSHLSMPSLSVPAMRSEITKVADRYEALTGEKMRYFRPPSGELSERSLAVAGSLGYVTVLWSLAYMDWEPLPGGPDESYDTIMGRLHNGAVILLHLTSRDNAEAFDRLVPAIKAAGYRFGTLDEIQVSMP